MKWRVYWRQFGVYRTLPLFFFLGAGIEWFMIHVQVGKETFCKLINIHMTSSSSHHVYITLLIFIIDDTVVRKEAERRSEKRKLEGNISN